ncbi:GLPGLI family protein [uncultured Nonlabens sp.]|uniref:GLPGLI family protein n=1 Tax=uncultured Nonlabens sp. TaxID=859306 RepID=UPI002635B1AF|nr:GLPGLI family protein [uncultured Nonlabens sp.]
MKLISLLILLVSFAGLSQNSSNTLTVKYDYYDSLLNDTFESLLRIEQDSSVYYVRQNLNDSEDSSMSNGNIMLGGVDDKYIFKNTKRNSLSSFESYDGKDYFMVNEKLPIYHWTLYDDYKTIQNYKCQKATTSFRGRVYTAWFTQDIATIHGPWKFNGLPGLIMQIADRNKYYLWSVKRITTNSNYEIPKITRMTKDVGLKKYHELVDLDMKKLRARVLSKLPKGTITTIPKRKRLGIETVYEWEIEDEKK